jgi:hypothetical protein
MARAMAERRWTVLCALETSRGPHTVLLHRAAARFLGASALQARGRGRTPPPGATSAVCRGAGVGVQATAASAGVRASGLLGLHGRPAPRMQRPLLRLTPGLAREASGAPTALTPPGATGPERRPWGVVTWQRRPAPAAGPGEATRGPGRVFSPIWSGTGGRRDGPGARAPPLPRRPRGETPGLLWCRRARCGCPPRLWHPCRGGQKRRQPARGGNAGERGGPPAGRGAA